MLCSQKTQTAAHYHAVVRMLGRPTDQVIESLWSHQASQRSSIYNDVHARVSPHVLQVGLNPVQALASKSTQQTQPFIQLPHACAIACTFVVRGYLQQLQWQVAKLLIELAKEGDCMQSVSMQLGHWFAWKEALYSAILAAQ